MKKWIVAGSMVAELLFWPRPADAGLNTSVFSGAAPEKASNQFP